MNTLSPEKKLKTIPQEGMGKFIHAVAWGILFGVPFFFTGRETEVVTFESYIRFMLMPLSFMCVFYINYLWLIPRFLFQKSIGKFLISNVLLIVGMMVLVHFLMKLLPGIPHPVPHREPPLRNIIGFFLGNAMLYMLVAALSVAIRMTGSWYQMEAMRQKLEQSRIEAELKNLKSQLNPHFLFNTLNNIYCLIAFSPEKAQEAVHDLSRLLRYVLYESSQPFVPLEKELNFIRNYVELMRIRLPKHVELTLDISVRQPGRLIAPLLFISLIENAFKHGVSNNKASFIRFVITDEGDNIYCTISNSLFPKGEQDKSGSGIGLQNLEKRLELLYPGKYQFIYGQIGEDMFRSELKIQTA